MFSVIFEVYPKEARFDDYLALAKRLKPVLEQVDGFVDSGRFGDTGRIAARARPGWAVLHPTGRKEGSVVRGPPVGDPPLAGGGGGSKFSRPPPRRAGDATADTAAPTEAPVHEQRFDATEV